MKYLLNVLKLNIKLIVAISLISLGILFAFGKIALGLFLIVFGILQFLGIDK